MGGAETRVLPLTLADRRSMSFHSCMQPARAHFDICSVLDLGL